ncbi:MAG: biotin--[Clostridia bacterium]|nr:biotin--[acetyl-CoA-carboxylase] ligase [Clostridia bacterium]
MMTFEVVWKDESVSTNTELKELAKKGAPVGSVLAAKRQSGGRGRMERSFSSEDGGLYASVIFPCQSPESAGRLTTFAAVAVSRAVERLCPAKVCIKWVNDLLVNQRKICGILAEGVAREDGFCAVVGFGINLCNKLPAELDGIASTLLDECGACISPPVLLDAILEEMSGFEKADFGEIMEEYRLRSAVVGKRITVCPHSDSSYEAEALAIFDDGSLSVRRLDNGVLLRVFSGEVSTKLSENKK